MIVVKLEVGSGWGLDTLLLEGHRDSLTVPREGVARGVSETVEPRRDTDTR